MNLARSTYYDAGDVASDDAVLGEIREIVEEFRGYGYRASPRSCAIAAGS